ncbi:MAG: DUF4389 domain-containing protein [Candidatus ainarchaeum sp.]|nr:DUF4389 domain-containing protein [Candidatus ainarchaeum sp.]
MKTVKYEVTYSENANRLELFVRWLWAIPSYIVLVVLAVIGMIAMLVQWLHILLLGKRHRTLHDICMKYLSYTVKFMSYFYLVTEERNPLMPED